MTRIVYKTHAHTRIRTLATEAAEAIHQRNLPSFEGVLQNIPIHQRELIAQEYIGYKSLRYISSVHQLAYFLWHSSIILRITSANFQNLKFEILLAYVTKCPLNAAPPSPPSQSQRPISQLSTYIYVCYILCICMCMLYMYL